MLMFIIIYIYICIYIHIYIYNIMIYIYNYMRVCIIGSRAHHATMYRLEIVNRFHNTTLINVNKHSLINLSSSGFNTRIEAANPTPVAIAALILYNGKGTRHS